MRRHAPHDSFLIRLLTLFSSVAYVPTPPLTRLITLRPTLKAHTSEIARREPLLAF